jgi:hypothetical protein
MATFAQDSFTDTNGVKLQSHTPETGGSWVQHTANVNELQILNNKCVQDDAGADNRVYYNNGTPGAADYYVQLVFRRTGTLGGGQGIGVLARLSTAALTGYYFRYNEGSGWQTYKVSAGTFTQIGSTTAVGLTLNQDYTIRLDVTGDQITVTVDGVSKCGSPITDSTHSSAGKSGIRFHFGFNQFVAADDFIAVDGTATGSPWLYHRPVQILGGNVL